MIGLRYFKYYSPRGYFDVYQHLTEYLRKDNGWRIYKVITIFGFLSLCILITSIVYLVYTYYEPVAPIVLDLLPGVLIAIVWLPFLLRAAISIRNPYWAVPELKALMLLFIPPPYTKNNGLTYIDIVRLLEIAETEQNSADWRGNNINLLVIGTVTGIASWILLLANKLRETTGEPLLVQILIKSVESLDFDLTMGMLALGIIFFSYIINKLYNYFQEYTLSETSNRIIIIACKELLSYLKDNNMTEENIAFSNKKTAIELFGCQLVEIWDYDYPLDIIIEDDKNTLWTLVSSLDSLSPPLIFYPWRNTRKTIKVLREIFMKYRKKSKGTKK